MLAAAQRLRDTGESPGTPGFDRLYGHIDETAEVDDPAYVLGRQLAMDDVVSVVLASAEKSVIDPDEGEAWLKVLGMTLSRRAAELDIRTEDDRARVGAEDEAVIRVAYTLQVALIDVLDELDARDERDEPDEEGEA